MSSTYDSRGPGRQEALNSVITSRSISQFGVSESIPEPNTLQKKTTIVVVTSAAVSAVLVVLWTARAALLLLFAGVMLAILLRTASRWIQRHTKLSPGWALASFLFGFTVLIALGIWLRGSEISSQLDLLQQKLPTAMHQLVAAMPNYALGRWLLRHGGNPQQLPRLMELLPRVTGVLSSTLGSILGLSLVIYVGITVAAEPETYQKGLERLFVPKCRARIAGVINEIEANLRRWLIARAASMCGVGLLVAIGLYLLHVPLAGTLGLFAAAMTFIPNLGPVLSVIPPAVLAFASSPKQALLVLILFALVHIVEGWFLTPIAERTVVRLPPALTLSAQLVLASIAGPIGVALAAPLTLIAIVLTRTLYVQSIEHISS